LENLTPEVEAHSYKWVPNKSLYESHYCFWLTCLEKKYEENNSACHALTLTREILYKGNVQLARKNWFGDPREDS
jgi:hypothetical protein